MIYCLLSSNNFEAANKALYYFINEGRVYAQKSVLAEVMGKVFQVLAKDINKFAGICRVVNGLRHARVS